MTDKQQPVYILTYWVDSDNEFGGYHEEEEFDSLESGLEAANAIDTNWMLTKYNPQPNTTQTKR